MKRKYLNRITVKQSVNSDDGYGGNKLLETNLGKSWCNINTIRTPKLVAYGLDITSKSIEIKLRYRADINYDDEGIYFTYKNYNYMPISIVQEGLQENEFTIIATATDKST